jgi:hypothetical protein
VGSRGVMLLGVGMGKDGIEVERESE